MAARMSAPVVRRPSLPLTAQDEEDLAALRSSPAFRRALEVVAPSQPSADIELGESALLHAIFEAGLAIVRRTVEDEGYEQLASDYAFRASERRSVARRRPPSWADEP